MSGKIATNPNRQSGVIGSAPSATTDASSPTITTNPSTGVGTEWINTTTGEIFLCTNATTDENIWVGQTGDTIQPTPWGDRGLSCGGHISDNVDRNDIGYINITSTGNTTDFGDLTAAGGCGAGWSNGSRGILQVGNESNNLDYITISTLGNAGDFGETSGGNMQPACGNKTRMVLASGASSNGYKYVEMDTLGDAQTFGDNLVDSGTPGLASNGAGDRMIKAGGRVSSASITGIEYITVSTTGNGTDFGDLTTARDGLAGSSNETRGVFYGGYIMPAPNVNVIDYITIATTGNATDFGDMVVNIRQYGATCNDARGIVFGGHEHGVGNENQIEYITIISTGNAADFGNIYTAVRDPGGLSGNV